MTYCLTKAITQNANSNDNIGFAVIAAADSAVGPAPNVADGAVIMEGSNVGESLTTMEAQGGTMSTQGVPSSSSQLHWID